MRYALTGWALATVTAVAANLLLTRNAPLVRTPSRLARRGPVQLPLPFPDRDA